MSENLQFRNEEEKELWKNVAAAVASASNATDKSTMQYWGDKAVEYFRERCVGLEKKYERNDRCYRIKRFIHNSHLNIYVLSAVTNTRFKIQSSRTILW